MTTAIWTCVRGEGSSWVSADSCEHGTTIQALYFASMLVSASEVQAAARPDLLHRYHLTRFDHDCVLVLSPIQAEDLTHATP